MKIKYELNLKEQMKRKDEELINVKKILIFYIININYL